MTAKEQFHHELLLTSFALASQCMGALGRAGMLDDKDLAVIRAHLDGLHERILAVPDPELQVAMQFYLDKLVAVLPPTGRGNTPPVRE